MSTESIIRDREELSEQIRALKELQEMAKNYGFDISGPARNAKEAVQWLYFAYGAAVKEQNGAAMSLGRVSTFLDIYFERDLKENTLTESQAQEIIDDFVIKLRIVRFLRTPEYDDLFAGDPTWSTPARCNSKATRSCAEPGATMAPSPAVFRPCSWASRCSSSGRARILPSVCYTQ
jgi:formate C-acetyltransferase